MKYSFTTSQQLDSLDIEINDFLAAYQTGKTDWTEEIITSSELLLNYMKANRFIVNRGQVLRFEDVELATRWKTLEHIYMNLGPSYKDRKDNARLEFKDAMAKRNFTFDKNSDASVDSIEINSSIRSLSR